MHKVVCLILPALAFANVAFAQHISVTPQQMRNLAIRMAPANLAQARSVVSVLGRVVPAPGAHIPVTAPFAGTVKVLRRLEGELVKKGQPLVVIASTDMRVSLGKYEGAQAQYRSTKAAAERAQALVSEGIAPASRAEEANAVAASAAAELAALRSAMGRVSAAGDGDYSLIAPVDGRIAGVSVSTGDQVAAMQPVLTLNTDDELWVEAGLPANQVGQVMVGDRAIVEGSNVTGMVVAAGSSIDPKTRSATVRIRLNSGGRFVPGQTLRLSIASGAGQGNFTVPRSAVVELGGRPVVFVARKGGFDAVPVRVMARGADLATVTGTLAPQDMVAITGVTELKAMGLQK